VGRRTERSYKAERPGETARHVEAQGSGRTVDGPLVQQQFTFLSRETCSSVRSSQCIDTPAEVAGPASYSARECAGAGNSVGGGAGVSRERSTAAPASVALAQPVAHDKPAASGRLEQDGRRGPRAISTATQKPQGPVVRRRRADEPGPHDDLMELVLSRRNMTAAYERVKANRGAPGVDGMTVDEFLDFARQHWDGIR